MMVGVLVRLTDSEFERWFELPAEESVALMRDAIRFFVAVDDLPAGWQDYRQSGARGVELQLPEEAIGEMDDFHLRHNIPTWVILRAAALQALADYFSRPAETAADMPSLK